MFLYNSFFSIQFLKIYICVKNPYVIVRIPTGFDLVTSQTHRRCALLVRVGVDLSVSGEHLPSIHAFHVNDDDYYYYVDVEDDAGGGGCSLMRLLVKQTGRFWAKVAASLTLQRRAMN
jgi:hypothetical protein